MTNTWYQQALTPASVLECNIRIGLLPDQDHAQWLVELKDPTTNILLAQESCPHFGLRDIPEQLAEALRRAQRLCEDASAPF